MIRSIAFVAACVALGACRVPPPSPDMAVAPTVKSDVREVALENGFITARIEIPAEPAGPKPAIITPISERDTLLAAGLVLIDYTVHWEQLRGLAPPPPPSDDKTVGKWLLASPASTVGKA